MDINMLNPKDSQEREVGLWLFRLSTAHADKPKHLARHKQWIAGKLQAAIRRATGQQEQQQPAAQQRVAESAALTFERARACTELLMRELSEVKLHGNRRA
jgi:hypothetical protein